MKKTITLVFCSVLTLFATLASAGPSNPFEQGTQAPVLSQEERASLLEYANNSKAKLEQALEDAKGLPFSQIQAIYLEVIKKVVIESAVSKPRSELLMRYALNQALELTYGIPTADGKGIAQVGVLKDSANQNLLIEILENSIELALNYYEDDRRAIQTGKLLDLPYAMLAQDRLEMARTKWFPAILEWGFQYNFSIAILKQFLTTIASEEQQHKAVFAEEIIKADSWLRFENQNWPTTWPELHKRVRVLRKNLKSLVNKLSEKSSLLGLHWQNRMSDENYKNMTLQFTVDGLYYSDFYRATFIANGTQILTHSLRGGSGATKLWDLKSNLVARYGTDEWSGESAMSPDGSKIVTGIRRQPHSGFCGALFDLSGNRLAILGPHYAEIKHTAFSSDGNLIVGAGTEEKAYIWDVTGKLLATLSGHEYGKLSYVTFSSDGEKVLTVSSNVVRGWDLKGNKLFTISGHAGDVSSATFSPDGTNVLTSSVDRTVKLWDLKGNLLRSYPGSQYAVFTPDGNRIAAGGDGRINIWDLNGNRVTSLEMKGVELRSIDFSPDGSKMVATFYSSFSLWHIGKRK